MLGQHRRRPQQGDQPTAESRVQAERLHQLDRIGAGLVEPGQTVDGQFRAARPGDRHQDVLAAVGGPGLGEQSDDGQVGADPVGVG